MKVARYDFRKLVHCMRPATTSTSPGCQDGTNRGCTCNCDGCNGRVWVDVEPPYTTEPAPGLNRAPQMRIVRSPEDFYRVASPDVPRAFLDRLYEVLKNLSLCGQCGWWHSGECHSKPSSLTQVEGWSAMTDEQRFDAWLKRVVVEKQQVTEVEQGEG